MASSAKSKTSAASPEWTEREVAVEELKPYERNPRRISKEAFARLVAGIKRNGYHQRIIATPDLRVIGGHQRIAALKELGIERVKVLVPNRKISRDQFREMLITDNLPFGEFDFDILSADFEAAELIEWGMPEDWLHLPPVEPEAMGDEDDVPEELAQRITKPGDMWRMGNHTIRCGDATNAADVAALFDSREIELLFTSPPYSDLRTYDGAAENLTPEFLAGFIDAAASRCRYMVVNLGLKRQDHEIVPYWNEYIDRARAAGYLFLMWGVWARPRAGSVGNQSAFLPCTHEWMFIFGHEFKHINRCEPRKTPPRNRTHRSVRMPDGHMQESTVGFQGKLKELESVVNLAAEMGEIRQLHPATFPVALPEKYIRAITDEGHAVFDPFSGSGSVIIAAEKTGRHAYAMEISPAYVDIAVRRWQDFTGQEAIDVKTGETFNSRIPIPAPREADAARLEAG